MYLSLFLHDVISLMILAVSKRREDPLNGLPRLSHFLFSLLFSFSYLFFLFTYLYEWYNYNYFQNWKTLYSVVLVDEFANKSAGMPAENGVL